MQHSTSVSSADNDKIICMVHENEAMQTSFLNGPKPLAANGARSSLACLTSRLNGREQTSASAEYAATISSFRLMLLCSALPTLICYPNSRGDEPDPEGR